LLKDFKYELKEIDEGICVADHRAMLFVIPTKPWGLAHHPSKDQRHDGSKLVIPRSVSGTTPNTRKHAKTKIFSNAPQTVDSDQARDGTHHQTKG